MGSFVSAKDKNSEKEIDARDADVKWLTSRSGARAGAGFRYQDAVGVYFATQMLSGAIPLEAITPESLDDYALEGSKRTIWVQVKSKIAPEATFSIGEIAEIISTGPGNDEDERWIVLDRPFSTYIEIETADPITLPAKLVARLTEKAVTSNVQDLATRLKHTKILILQSPLERATDQLVETLEIVRLAARACSAELLYRVGQAASDNARTEFANRRSETCVSLRSYCDSVLAVIDPDTVASAIRNGSVVPLSFSEPNPDPEFFRGISVDQGHIAAGLAVPRPQEADEIGTKLVEGRDVLICGPSGAGKSTLAYLTAFEYRRTLRWFEIKDLSSAMRTEALAFLRGMAPNPSRPVAVYFDDVGRGGEAAWNWLKSQARSLPGLICVGSVREEDLAIVNGRSDTIIHRPVLNEELAESIWRELKERDQSKLAFWSEAYEESSGLMLEYVHILTQGRRLKELCEEQIDRRMQERREHELTILPIVACAGRFGVSVDVERLRQHLNLTAAEFGRAYKRLHNEHLVGEQQDGLLRGLHEIRSEAIYDACLEQMMLKDLNISKDTVDIICEQDFRRYLTRSGRVGVLNDNDAIRAFATRFTLEPSYRLLVEALEAFRLRSIARDAKVFHDVATDLNISHRHYMLCLLVMNAELVKGLEGAEALRHLVKFHEKFRSRRSPDARMALLDVLPAVALTSAITSCKSPNEVVRLATALHGCPFEQISDAQIDALTREIEAGDLAQIAEFLAILCESDPSAARHASSQLGGSSALLDRLLEETDWALQPTLENGPDGELELTADMLAVGDEAVGNAETFVNAHAGLALQLCPEAQYVNARPLQLSGEALTISGFTPGLKRLGRAVVSSKANIAWNRMIIHAVAGEHGATSLTEVLERHRFGLGEALSQLEQVLDYVSRGKKLKPKQRQRALALAVMEDLLPTYPLSTPEEQLANPLGSEISDPVGTLIVSISEFLVALIDAEKTGHQLASYAADIIKSCPEVKEHHDWVYIGGPPSDVLEELQRLVSAFRPALVATGHRKIAQANDIFSVQRNWKAGTGLSRLSRRMEYKWNAEKTRFTKRIEKKLKAKLYINPHSDPEGVLWPNWTLCMIKPCKTLVEFFIWLGDSIEVLQKLAESSSALSVAPSFGGTIPAQLAFRVFPSIPVLPDEDFQKNWNSTLSFYSLAESRNLRLYQQASNAIVSVYASQSILGEKTRTKVENEQIQDWADEVSVVVEKLTQQLEQDQDEGAGYVLQRIVDLNDRLIDNEENGTATSVEYSQKLFSAALASDENEESEDLFELLMVVISYDLNIPIDAEDIEGIQVQE